MNLLAQLKMFNGSDKTFNDIIQGIQKQIESFHTYIQKSNTEYERRLKENGSGRRSSVLNQEAKKL